MVLMNQPWPHACLNFHSNKVACAGPTHMVAKILRGHGVVPRVTTEGRARGDERASRAYCYNGEQSTPGHKGNWCLELEVSSHGGNDFFSVDMIVVSVSREVPLETIRLHRCSFFRTHQSSSSRGRGLRAAVF